MDVKVLKKQLTDELNKAIVALVLATDTPPPFVRITAGYGPRYKLLNDRDRLIAFREELARNEGFVQRKAKKSYLDPEE